MNKFLYLAIIFMSTQVTTTALADSTLSFPEGVWVGEYTCRGNSMPMMIEFDGADKPASVAYIIKRKKNKTQRAKFHANVERITNKKGDEILIFNPKYWLHNPGQTSMLKLRSKYTEQKLEGNIKKK